MSVKTGRVAQCIEGGVNLGGQATATTDELTAESYWYRLKPFGLQAMCPEGVGSDSWV